jgi:hypothetical protein
LRLLLVRLSQPLLRAPGTRLRQPLNSLALRVG